VSSLRLSGIGMTSQRTRARLLERLREQGIGNEEVLAAMGAVPRHIFVDEALASRAYEDTALPIGFGQTISHPFTVARMTEILFADARPEKVLEIGTGCGYQAAVLSRLAKEVFTVERIAPLMAKARKHLQELRVNNVRFKHSDGGMGLPEAAPYDAILVTAAATHVPHDLLGQLKPGGRLVIPVGAREQRLVLIEHMGTEYRETTLEAVRFVPLLAGKA
jgi:protein-L-isoaspartate(D-aspartate) O-methyltransferase